MTTRRGVCWALHPGRDGTCHQRHREDLVYFLVVGGTLGDERIDLRQVAQTISWAQLRGMKDLKIDTLGPQGGE